MNEAEWTQASIAIVRGAAAHLRTGMPSISGSGPLLHSPRSGGEASAAESRGPRLAEGSAPSLARAFEWRGVTLRFPALSRSGVRGDDGMVVFAMPRARVRVNDWGCSCPLWLPSDAGQGVDGAGGLERLQHCRLAVRHGEAEGFLLDGDVAPAASSEALALRVVKAGAEYWATWGAAARAQVCDEREKSFRAYA